MRRYDRGEVVGEREPAMARDEFVGWCQDERRLAGMRRQGESFSDDGLMTRAYLTAREATLHEVLERLGED